jgi:hypothetical protein
MARGRIRRQHRLTEIGEVIVAEWYRVLTSGDSSIDGPALTAAFSRIIDLTDPGLTRHNNKVVAVPDVVNSPMKIVVPLPPYGVNSVGQLDNYLDENFDFV